MKRVITLSAWMILNLMVGPLALAKPEQLPPLPPLKIKWKLQQKTYRIEHLKGKVMLEGPGFRHRSRLDSCNVKLYRNALQGLTKKEIKRRYPASTRLRLSTQSQTGYKLKTLPNLMRGIMTYEQRVCSKQPSVFPQKRTISIR